MKRSVTVRGDQEHFTVGKVHEQRSETLQNHVHVLVSKLKDQLYNKNGILEINLNYSTVS
jgi:hypothetical protein